MTISLFRSLLHSLFPMAPDSLVRQQQASADASMRWFPWINLVWSVWLFVTPFYATKYYPDWLWPTLASYAVFLLLFHRFHYGRHRLPINLAIAALGFALLPYNPGSQSYIIYACAFFPFCMGGRKAMLAILALLAAYATAWHAAHIPMIYMSSGVIAGVVVGLFNIGMRQKLRSEAQLRLSHEEVRRLAALAERERIGRDLHDLLGHTLSLVALKSNLASRLIGHDPAAARKEMDDVSDVARDALTQVRRAVSGIRAAGLAAELASARLLLESDGVRFNYEMSEVALSAEQETVLALAVREAVTNIQRHARAAGASVSLRSADQQVSLRIQDDGRGGAIVPGNGLCGMRERIESLGGRLRVDAAPGQGTCVEVTLPLVGDRDSGLGIGD
ncbi:sensor histidine kinase [Pseudoxanthomonas sp. CF125]|uniref:sensor histidine kinase n=1 Tax=Pseudoxanthomonas sp. CF125 TaxID=1855303 RepID=UPI0008882D56|nr:sensor histidine kinase [Pseudoxanthomonas sp. CF125]SDQ83636.1 two-component system, NarL family, sensor histidine kinase DesK [Pseudoxanthomonas sp. CF125]